MINIRRHLPMQVAVRIVDESVTSARIYSNAWHEWLILFVIPCVSTLTFQALCRCPNALLSALIGAAASARPLLEFSETPLEPVHGNGHLRRKALRACQFL